MLVDEEKGAQRRTSPALRSRRYPGNAPSRVICPGGVGFATSPAKGGGVLPRVAMEFMRHSEMRLTNKTYTDVTCLPLAEAAEMLPQFLQTKGTHETGAEGHKPSRTDANQIREAKHKTIDNKEVCHALSSTGAEGQELEVAHPIGVEPITC